MPPLSAYANQQTGGVFQHNVDRTHGDDWILRPTFRQKDNRGVVTPLDVSDWVLTAQVYDSTGASRFTGTVTVAGLNVVTILFNHIDTGNLAVGFIGSWDLVGVTPEATIHTLVQGDVYAA